MTYSRNIQSRFDKYVKETGDLVFLHHTKLVLILLAERDDFKKSLNTPESPLERLIDAINGVWNFNVAESKKTLWCPSRLSIDNETDTGFIVLKSESDEEVVLTFEMVTSF